MYESFVIIFFIYFSKKIWQNQDRHCYGYDFQRHIAWLGISDGHVGSGAADYIARHLIKNIQRYAVVCMCLQLEVCMCLRMSSAICGQQLYLSSMWFRECIYLHVILHVR